MAENIIKGKREKKLRQGCEKKSASFVGRPTPVSLGELDRRVLGFMFRNPGDRFNVRRFSHEHNLARSTVQSVIERLQRHGFAQKDHYGNATITHSGKCAFEAISKYNSNYFPYADGPRRECRDFGEKFINDKSVNLSTHYTKFVAPILDRNRFDPGSLARVGTYEVNQMQNWLQYIVYLEGATIIINPRQVVIRVHDILTGDAEEAHFKTLTRAVEALAKVRALGLETDRIELEAAHYARIESHLADSLAKIDGRYFLDLGDGKKFWIDRSLGKLEDETNDLVSRERLDNLLRDAMTTDSRLSDLDKMKDLMGLMVRMQALQMMQNLPQSPPPDRGERLRDKPFYTG